MTVNAWIETPPPNTCHFERSEKSLII